MSSGLADPVNENSEATADDTHKDATHKDDTHKDDTHKDTADATVAAPCPRSCNVDVAPVSDIDALLIALQEDTLENTSQSHKQRFPESSLLSKMFGSMAMEDMTFGDMNFDDEDEGRSNQEESNREEFFDDLDHGYRSNRFADTESSDTIKYLVTVCDDTSDNVTNLMDSVRKLRKEIEELRLELKTSVEAVLNTIKHNT